MTTIKLVATLLILLASTGTRADPIVVVSDYWYPYNGEVRGERRGYKIDLMTEIAEAAGRRLDYRLMDWELALARTLEGRGEDCVVGAIASDAPHHVLSREPWGLTETMIFAHAERMPAIREPESLHGLRIGIIADYSYGDILDPLLASDRVQVTRVEASRRAFPRLVLLLTTNQIDILLEDVNVAAAGLRELRLEGTVRRIDVDWLEAESVHVACTPNDRGREIIRLMDAGLRQARASGALQRTLDRYGLAMWPTD